MKVSGAKRLSEKYLLNSGIKDGKFFFAHTKGVVSVVEILSEKFGLDSDLMISCAWVHDIGYFLENDKPHAENSLELLEEEGISLNESEKDCILNHGNSGEPLTSEGKIMKIADKLSIMNVDFLKEILKGEIGKEEKGFVEMMFKKALERIDDLDEFY